MPYIYYIKIRVVPTCSSLRDESGNPRKRMRAGPLQGLQVVYCTKALVWRKDVKLELKNQFSTFNANCVCSLWSLILQVLMCRLMCTYYIELSSCLFSSATKIFQYIQRYIKSIIHFSRLYNFFSLADIKSENFSITFISR